MNVSSKRTSLSAVFLIIFIGTIIYANTLNVPFYFDDIPNIKNSALQMESISCDDVSKVISEALIPRRPVSNLSFAFNYYIGGYKVHGYHLVNIFIHLLTGIFLFLFLRATLILPVNREQYGSCNQGLALLSALLWLVHPLATQSVTYLVQRMNSMAAMFYVLALLLYVMGRSRQIKVERRTSVFPAWICFVASGFSGLLAIGSKEIAATLPMIIFLYEWYFFQDLQWNWLRKKIYWLIAAGFIFGILAVLYLGKTPWHIFFSDCSGRDFTAYERLLTQFRVVMRYISLLLYPNPNRLALDYDFPFSISLVSPVTTLYSFIGVLFLLVLSLLLARRERLLSFCILWFFGNLVIESSVICLEIIYEHRTYLPSMLFFLVPVAVFFRLIKLKRNVVLLFVPIILCLGYWTVERNKMWQDPFLFWQDNLYKQPAKARVHNNFGMELYKKGQVKLAEQEFKTAIRLVPKAPYPQLNLGELLWHAGQLQEAEGYFLEAIRSDLTYMKAYLDLAALLYETGRIDEALEFLEEAYALDSDHVGLNKMRGNLLLRSNQPQEALVYLEYALQEGGNDAEISLDQGEAFVKLGNIDSAIHAYKKALQVNNRLVAGHYNLAMLYQKKGELGLALRHFKRAVSHGNPAGVPVRYNYANFLLRQKRFDEAEKMYSQFLSSIRYMENAYNNLGLLYIQQERFQEAVKQFRLALRISPNNQLIKKNLEMARAEVLNSGSDRQSLELDQ